MDLLPWALLGWLIDTIAGDLCFYCYICVSMSVDRNAPWSIWTSATGCSGHCGHARHAGHAGQAGHGGSRVLYFWRRQPPQCAHSEPADQLGSLGGRGVLSSSFSPFSRASPVCPGKGKSVLKLLPQGCLGAEACWEGGTRYPPNPPLKVCFSSWGHFGKFQIGFSYIHLL